MREIGMRNRNGEWNEGEVKEVVSKPDIYLSHSPSIFLNLGTE
jgi:hypothetical protein